MITGQCICKIEQPLCFAEAEFFPVEDDELKKDIVSSNMKLMSKVSTRHASNNVKLVKLMIYQNQIKVDSSNARDIIVQKEYFSLPSRNRNIDLSMFMEKK